MPATTNGPAGLRPSPLEGLASVALRPRQRYFIVGSTGSGKSTLSAALLEFYRDLYPSHFLYIIDPKRRFVPVELDDDEGYRLFPDGYQEVNHGRRDGVSVAGSPLGRIPRTRNDGSGSERTFVVQDDTTVSELFSWLYRVSDVRTPSLVYLDESFDTMRGNRADPGLRRLLQQGREIGTGLVIINQRPAWIDQTFISEADGLYIGSLNKSDDRDRIAKEAAADRYHTLLASKLPRYTWLFSDQHNPARSRAFRLRMES